MNPVAPPRPERGARSGDARLWCFAALLAAVGVLYFASHLRTVAPASGQIRWWLVAPAFVLTEAFVVSMRRRRGGESFSMSELPMVFGLFVLAPGDLVLAQVAGSAVALVALRRQPPARLAFNLSLIALSSMLAAGVFHAVASPGNPASAGEIAGGLLAALTFGVVGTVAVSLAIALVEGVLPGERLRVVAGFGAVMSVVAGAIGVVSAVTHRIAPPIALLWTVPATALLVAYRSYAEQQRRHKRLGELYESMRSLQRSLDVDETAAAVLERARMMFRAEVAVLTVHTGDGGREHRLDASGTSVRTIDRLDPTDGVWARAVAEAEPVLLSSPIRNERLRASFAAHGIRDAVVAPMFAGEQTLGTLMVANRAGDGGTFGKEDAALLQALALQAGTALVNAQLVAEMQGALDRQTELNRLKDEFVATVSHELRTPLTAIDGFAKTLLRTDREFSPEERREFVLRIDRQALRLRAMIEDLLLASQIEQRQVRVDPKTLDAGDLVGQVVDSFRAFDERRPIAVDVPAGVAPVRSDEVAAIRILTNLVQNAIKYSPEGSRVAVRAIDRDGGVQFEVVDLGIGVPADEAERIFERFYQVDGSSTRQAGGAGLGLYISRRLAGEIGGKLWLERSRPGEGSTFCLWLPAAAGRDEEMRPLLRVV